MQICAHVSTYLSIYGETSKILTLCSFSTIIINIWQVFAKGVDRDMVVLMAARASRLENQDAIDSAIVSMLADPKEVLVQRH